MTDFHTIRLLGPWQAEFFPSPTSGNEADTPDQQRVKLPLLSDDWIEQSFAGEIRLHRSFNWPHEIDPDQTFLIAIDSNIAWQQSLNSHSFDATTPNLAAFIQPTNRLTLQASIEPDVAAPIISEVRLLVR